MMRRLIAIGCCAAFLMFGFVADVAHVHGASDDRGNAGQRHHGGGLHLDHAHVNGESHDHHSVPVNDNRSLSEGVDGVSMDRTSAWTPLTQLTNVTQSRLHASASSPAAGSAAILPSSLDGQASPKSRRLDIPLYPRRGPSPSGPIPARAPPA